MALATDSWLPLVQARVPGSIPAVVLAELQQTILDFCRDTTAWRGVERGYDILTGVRTVDLNRPAPPPGPDRKVIGVIALYKSGLQQHDLTHFPVINGTIQGWTATGDDPAVIELPSVPLADALAAIDAWVYYEPTDIVTLVALPVVFTTHYWETIYDGALARMFMQPDKPYSSGQAAGYHGKRYQLKKASARSRAAQGFTPSGQNWSYPNFA